MKQTIKNRIDQIKNGQVPKGYKKTNFGVFPSDWEKIKLQSICEFLGGGTPNTKKKQYWNGVIPWVSSSDLMEGDIRNINITRYISKEALKNSATKKCPKNSILLVSRVGVGKMAIAPIEICTSQDFTNIINLQCNIEFLAYQLLQRIKRELAKVQGTSIQGLSGKEIKALTVILPKDIEQAKIAEILMQWDMGIEKQEQLISKLETRKKALMQKLLTPKKGWQESLLKNFIAEELDKSTVNNQYPIITSSKNGMYKQSDYFNKQVASENNIGYLIIKRGEFTYRSMSDNGDFTFNMFTLDDFGLVSPAYTVFNIVKGYNRFFKYFLNSIQMKQKIKTIIEGSTRVALKFKSLLLLKVVLPDINEQKRIANILSLADKEIDLHKQKLDKLKEQRKSLMQLLLTGIVRVTI